MQCERSGEYKPPKTRKKPNLEGTGFGLGQRSRTFGFAKKYCGCVQMTTTYGLPCACIIDEKRKKNCLFYWMKYTLIGKG